jgi:hypothetical protein
MSTKQHVGGFTQLADGVQAAGKILTLDATDALIWATPPKGYISITELAGEIGVVLTNITGPVTYQWSFADGDEAFSFSSATNIEHPTFLKDTTTYLPFLLDPTLVTGGSGAAYRWSTLLKVIVTDAIGHTYSAYYSYSKILIVSP